MPRSRGNALIGQSGGPTAVINQSLVGIVETLLDSDRVRTIYGAVHGIQGVLGGHLIDLSREKAKTLEAVARTPSSALRSVRKKPTPEECRKILDELERLDVHWFFYIGGNDSAETARLIESMAQEDGYELFVFHVPKTIDNDLRVTDHCPGYPSAAKFVAQAMMGDNLDNRSLPGIKIDVIMGRHAGWLTAASALARRFEDDGPHLIYVPERTFDLARFAADVDRVVKQHGRCVVAVSEGIHGPDGKTLVEAKERDSHGNVQLSGSGALGDLLAAEIKTRLGAKRVRADTFGYLQRSYVGVTSEVDAKEARAVGRFAAKMALKGKLDSASVVIVREKGKKGRYASSCDLTAIANVAKDTRPLEPRFLKGDHDVTPAFLDYVRPLVGDLPEVARLSDFAPKRKKTKPATR
ncbi:MAG: 6-phosphofructokinase [Planctomycetes bacterium]|nr:6-phosphofructokinase [Planctomycetota bacterium]